jgi:hypothetical protein
MAARSNNPVVSLPEVFRTYKIGEVDVPAVKESRSVFRGDASQ